MIKRTGYIEKIHLMCSNWDTPVQLDFDWPITYIRYKGELLWAGSDGYGWVKSQIGDYFSGDVIERSEKVEIVYLDDMGNLIFLPYQEHNLSKERG